MKPKLFLFLFFLPALVFASSTSSLGKKLTQKVWHDLKHQNVSQLDSYLSADFQSVNFLGALSRAELLTLAGKIQVQSYAFSAMRTTKHHDKIVVTYGVTAQETNQGNTFKVFGPQMNVWEKQSGRWVLVSWSDLSVNM